MTYTPKLALGVALIALTVPACHGHRDGDHGPEQHKVVATSPVAKDVVITQPYVCQIRACQNTEILALVEGYLERVPFKEGQAVKKDDVLFTIYPPLFKAKLEAEKAEVQYAKIKYETTKNLHDQKVVSDRDVALHYAELGKAEAKLQSAEAELAFTTIRAPYDGIVDRQNQQQGSLVKKEVPLTTISDTSTMWVYFNVPEARYLDYMTGLAKKASNSRFELADSRIELVLANGKTFNQSPGNTVTVEGQFDNKTGNIPFRADFPNPDRLLRHGQTGTVLIRRNVKGAVVIPQRATFEILDKLYVWVIGDDHTVHQRPITVAHELEDIYVIQSGLDPKDKIVLEGVQQVHEGDKVEYQFQQPGDALTRQKQPAQ